MKRQNGFPHPILLTGGNKIFLCFFSPISSLILEYFENIPMYVCITTQYGLSLKRSTAW